jgi:hypothetical protein
MLGKFGPTHNITWITNRKLIIFLVYLKLVISNKKFEVIIMRWKWNTRSKSNKLNIKRPKYRVVELSTQPFKTLRYGKKTTITPSINIIEQ